MKWEYLYIRVGTGMDVTEIMSAFGLDCWELVSACIEGSIDIVLFFKRPKV
jgi:hypothetical protein